MASITPPLAAEKSTNVRPAMDRHEWLRRLFGWLCVLSPQLAARAADWFFFRPPRSKAPAREAAWLRTAAREVHDIGEHRIVAHAWGQGPTVLLVHGWAGRAGQMGAIGTALAAAGFRAVAFDAPGHGESSGRVITMPDFVTVIAHLAGQAGGLFGIVGHSMGGAATTVALAAGLTAEGAVVLGAPSTLDRVVGQFAQTIGLSSAATEIFRGRLESRFGRDIWERFSPARLVEKVRVPAVVIHDREDEEVPHAQALQTVKAWPGAELYSTGGLGHTRMLRAPAVVERIVTHMVATLRGAKMLKGSETMIA